jgi:GNAT superfamily N-acetyltransferase
VSVEGKPTVDDVEVRAVSGLRELRAFIQLPYRLHAGTPWVPPVKVERWAFLNRRLNAYFRHGRARYFLARRGGRVVGRITAQVDAAFNEFHASRWGMFGFLEFEDDPGILEALLRAAETWLRTEGCDRMVGPMDFSLNDESGVLIEGFALEPQIKQPWHPPYYQRRCEEAGLGKAMDLLSWFLEIDDRTRVDPRLPALARRASERHGIRIRKLSRRHLRRELDAFADVYNQAWSKNWGFVPYAAAELDTMALEMQLVYAPGWFMVAEHDGETVAMAFTIMNLNQVLKKMKGRLLPWGWWYLVNRGRIVDEVRVGFLGVKPAYQYTGVAAALYMEHFNTAEHSRMKKGEAGWILETNRGMNRGLEAMNARIVKRYRVYQRVWADPDP